MKSFIYLIVAGVLVAACDPMKSVKDTNNVVTQTNGKMDNMSNQLAKTSDVLHLKALQDAKNEMLSPDNTVVPDNPVRLIPAGKAFGEEATPLELAQLVEVWITEINELQPGEYNKVNGQVPDALIEDLEKQKIARLTALQVVMGFAPQAKVEQMISDQIDGQGRYERAVMQGLMLRALFIQSYRVGVAILDKEIQNLGQLQEALDLAEQVDFITRLPFAPQIGIKLQMLKPEHNIDEKLDLKTASNMWNDIDDNMKAHLAPRMKTATQAQQNVFAGFQGRVDNFKKYWKVH